MKYFASIFVLFIWFTASTSSNLQAQPRTFVPKGTQTTSNDKVFKTNKEKKSLKNNTSFSSNSQSQFTKKKKSKKTENYPKVASMLDFAEQYMGTPYKWGGTTSRGFDCSGYVQYVFQHAGHQIQRVSKDQSKEGKKVSFRKVQKGDLLFFGEKKRKITHVGLVVSGKGEPLKMIHASSSKGITITNVENSTYWKPKLQKARRVLNKHELKMVNAKNKRQLKRAAKKYWRNV